MIGSILTGGASVLTGGGSSLTAGDSCDCPYLIGGLPSDIASRLGGEWNLTGGPIVCACGIKCLPSGQTVFSTGLLPTEHQIGSRAGNVWVEIPIGNVPVCPNGFQTKVTVDIIDLNLTDDGVWTCYVATSGSVAPAAPTSFASNGIANALCSTHVSGTYATYNLTSVGPTWHRGDAIANANPLSFYIWPPVTFPNFVGSTQKYKNLTAKIVAV